VKPKRLLLAALALSPLFLSGCFMDTLLGDMVNQTPRAVIDATPLTGAAPLDVEFDGHYSHDDDGAIAEYHWDFGDPQDRVFSQDAGCVHTYSTAGTYLATLTVVDDEGLSDAQQIAIVVTNPPPVAEATVSNDSPLPGREVVFDASSSYDLGGSITSYEWDFDDGTTASGQIVYHTFIEGGYYSVTLTLTDDDGATAMTRVGVNVQPGSSSCGGDGSTCGGTTSTKPYAVISGMPSCSGGQVGVPIRLDGTASRAGEAANKITSYVWDLGDGTVSTEPTVTHTYTSVERLVIVTLTVTNDLGESSTAYASFAINASGGGSTCD